MTIDALWGKNMLKTVNLNDTRHSLRDITGTLQELTMKIYVYNHCL